MTNDYFIMERPVIFLQSLLVFVLSIQVIYSCKCDTPRSLEKSICLNETLLMATPESKYFLGENRRPTSDINLASFIGYKMFLNNLYYKGTIRMFGRNDYFQLISPLKPKGCHVALLLNTEYYITGSADEDGSLLVNSCDYVATVPWELDDNTSESLNDLLTRHKEIDCNGLE